MARTIYYVGSSMDGYIADRRNKLDWLMQFNDATGVQDSIETFLQQVGAIVMGSETYKFLLAEGPDAWAYGSTPTWVFTHHELPGIPGADITFVRGDVDIFHPSICADAGESDVWLMGGGQPLLPVSSTTARARLRATRALGDLVEMHYDLTPVTQQ